MSVEGDSEAGAKKRHRWRYVFGAYLCLLLISHLIRLVNDPGITLHEDQASLEVKVVDEGQVLDEAVSIAFTLFEPDSVQYPDPPSLILLHGSPMASRSMLRLAAALPDSFRKVVPDLPGFGRSTSDIPDYSIESGAVYVNQLMDSLGIEEAHLVGYSMSGGVVLHQYEMAPEKVKSIVMLSAIGVQEHELLGSYQLNHAVHGVQLAFLWGLQTFFPHMGFMDGALLSTRYARNFYDTDQRPLRGILQRYEGPMLIMHGESDPQVPVSAAFEHERLVPQSTLALFEGGHGLVFGPSVEFLTSLIRFVNVAEVGEAPVRATATQERIQRANEPFDESTIPKAEGLTLLVYMLLIALATLVSEDATCIAAGLLVAQGTIAFIPATLACLIGIVGGDCMLFFIGRFISAPLLEKAPFRWFISKEALEDASKWLEERGAAVIIASRFIPGSRMPTYVSAGSLRLPFWTFLFYFMIASLLWTPMLVGFSVLFGEQLLMRFLDVYEGYAIWVFVGAILLILSIMKVVVPMFSHQGRRGLVGSVKRKIHWEFWPLWFFYPPIVLYILYLGIRYRSFTLFTAANPGIDMGGLVGESKLDILNSLNDDEGFVATFHGIMPAADVNERFMSLQQFMTGEAIQYPVILKPDMGERGKGVQKIYSDEEAIEYIKKENRLIIAQEYARGSEFGVFYYRYPNEESGKIFSITDKQFPTIIGDGYRSLHRLIIDDNRAVAMARHYFKANQGRLHDVPDAGQIIKLVDIGTHSRGAIFLDGEAVYSQALEATIDRISKRFKGFYFGRFDIRTDSIEAFRDGCDFKIVELNGVTSEATHIYDPKNSVWYAYKTLMNQWKIAFEIADQNRKKGIRPTSLSDVVRRVLK